MSIVFGWNNGKKKRKVKFLNNLFRYNHRQPSQTVRGYAILIFSRLLTTPAPWQKIHILTLTKVTDSDRKISFKVFKYVFYNVFYYFKLLDQIQTF